MGRRPKGYILRRQRKGGLWSARFTVDGERTEFFTGERDRTRADRVAREAYAEALQGRTRRATRRGTFTTELAGRWLDALTVRPVTRKLYRKYTLYWLRGLPSFDSVAIQRYVRQRLGEVRAKTLKSELSAMRNLLAWMVEVGELDEAPEVPRLDHSKMGTPSEGKHRVAAPDYTEAEIRKVLRKLPVKSPSGFHVRARFVALYETGLRPTTVDALSVPEHWSPGSKSLRITDAIDKEGFARTVPITETCRRALTTASSGKGPIFGEHRYARHIPDSARKTLPAHKGEVFTGQHLRSARATHLLDSGAPLSGVQFLLGHRSVSTTGLYVRPSEAAARTALFGSKGGSAGRKRR